MQMTSSCDVNLYICESYQANPNGLGGCPPQFLLILVPIGKEFSGYSFIVVVSGKVTA